MTLNSNNIVKFMSSYRNILFFALLPLWLGGCAVREIAAAGPSADSGSAAADQAYRLDAGDRVRVTVYGEADLTGDYTLSPSGSIGLPLLGDIPATGITTRELSLLLGAALGSHYLREPRVSVSLIAARPFYILGEVRTPGEYPSAGGLTVVNAVAKAGGFTYRANTRYVYLRRKGEAAEKRVPLTVATPVNPGDTVRIPERFF
jgi:protein involved in polysaccharide export with SLBB domain